MDSVEQNKTEYQEQGPRKGIVIIVITILLGTNGLLLWQFFDKKSNLDDANQTIFSVTAERDALQSQLNEVNSEFEKVKSENVELQNQLSEKDEQIKIKVAEIQRLISQGGPAQIARAKAELAKLKEMNQVYISQIDSLNGVTAALQAENKNLSTNLVQEKSKNENLSAENSRLSDKVAAGSLLKAFNLVTEGFRYKSNGNIITTNKAKQVINIRTTFTLGENHVIDKGQIDIYIRVTGPDGTVMASNATNSQETFVSNGQNIAYTAKQTVDYANTDLPVTVNLTKGGSQFTKGKYKVEVYHHGVVIGTSSVDLK